MIEVYKLLNMKEDTDYRKFFELSDNINTRGHTMKLKTRQSRKDFSIRVVNNWNGLPESIVSSPSINVFKNRLDNYMGNAQYTTYPGQNWVYSHEGVI